MIDYEKIAAIVLRGLTYYLLMFAAIEWIIIGAGVLLMSLGLFPRGSIALEGRLLSSAVYLIAGFVLLRRSKSLAIRIVQSLEEDEVESSS